MKTCVSCSRTLAEDRFGRTATRPDGLHVYCRECRSKMGREFRDGARGSQRSCARCGAAFTVTSHPSYCRACATTTQVASARSRAARDPAAAHLRKKDQHLRAAHGITLAQYEEMLQAQGGGCAICGATRSKSGRKLSVDHDHATGTIRGLLCAQCNYGLGQFGDRADLLRRAAEYLARVEAATVQ